jgi:biopolymer transport protein ExbD
MQANTRSAVSNIENTSASVGANVMRPSNQIWIGSILVLISTTVLIAVHQWISSRTFTPVNKPISLSRGFITAGPFNINLNSNYDVRIDTGWESYNDPNCPSYGRLKTRWRLYRDGSMAVKWVDASDPYLGDFLADKGTYYLDLEILSDTACLNPGRPRLLVFTDRGEYADKSAPVLWASAFGVALGASLAMIGIFTRSVELRSRAVRISDSASIGQFFEWAQKLPLRKKFSPVPTFALLATPGLVILIIVFMVLQPSPSKGIYVHLLKTGPLTGTDNSLVEPVVVQIADLGPNIAPSVHVNSKTSSWKDLAADLKDQLKLRPDWVVYVSADPNVSWANVVIAADVAEGLHAKAVLTTTHPARNVLKARNKNK